MLYFKILLGVIICVILFSLLGQFVVKNNKPFNSFLSNFAYKQIIGSFTFVSVYALILTNFKTIFVLALPLIFALYYFNWKNKSQNHFGKSFVKSDILFISLFLLFSSLISFLVIRGELVSGMKVPIKDQAFYSILAKSMAQHSAETYKSMFLDYVELGKILPYHYYELWLASSLIKFFDINPLLAQSGIAYTYSIFILFCVVMGFLEGFVTSKSHKIAILLFTLTFIFHRSWLGFIMQDDLYSESIFFDGHYKFVHLVPFFLLVIQFIYNGQNWLAAIFFLMLPVINTITLPWVGLTFIVYLIFVLFKFNLINLIKVEFWFLITLIFYLVLGVYYLSLIENTNGSGFIKSIVGIFNNIIFNGSKWLLLNIPLIIILYFFRMRIGNYKSNILFIFLFLIFSISLLTRAILDTNQNSFQIFLSASFLLVYGMVFILAIQMLNYKKGANYLFLLSVISIVLFVQNYKNIFHVFKKNISKYDLTYVNQISKVNLENSKGLKVVNSFKMTNLMKNPVYAGFNEYFVFNDKLYRIPIINTEKLIPSKSDSSLQANILRNEFIPLCFYNSMTGIDVFENDSIKKSLALKKYINIYKPSFLIVDGGCDTPIEFEKIIKKVIVDKNSNERFYILETNFR